MPTPAHMLLMKLNKTIPKKYKYAIKESTATCLLAFADYLDELKRKHVAKDKSDDLEYMIGAILKDARKIKNEKEGGSYCKIQLSYANKKFQELVLEIRKEDAKLKRSSILRFTDLIREYIYDLKFFIEFFETKSNPSFKLFEGGKTYANYSHEVFRIANNLYWNGYYKENIFDQKMATNISCFTLRQSLELRFKGICGVKDIHNESFNGPKLKHEYFAEFIEANASHFELPYTSVTYLLKVYSWTNYTVHTAYNPLIWELKLALDYCLPFFKWGRALVAGRHVEAILGSVKINKYEEMKQKLQQDLQARFPGEKINVIFMKQPEAIVLN